VAGNGKRPRGTKARRGGDTGAAFGRFVVALIWLLLAVVLLAVVEMGRRFYGV